MPNEITGISPDDVATPLLLARPYLLRTLTNSLVICGISYAAFYLLVLGSDVVAWMLVVASVAAMFTPVIHSYSDSPTIPANYLLGVLFAALASLILVSGGVGSPVLMWLIVLPTTATILNGPLSGLIWLIVIVVHAVWIAILQGTGHGFLNLFTASEIQTLDIAAVLGLAALVYLFVYVYHHQLCSASQLLHHQASHDELTGLFNYRAMVARLDLAARQSKSAPLGFALIMIDVDHFKSINDRFGHAMGDVVLQQVAARIHACVRDTDYLGRFGGEEFLCLLPGCPGLVAETIAENICRTVASSGVASDQSEIGVSVSLGVAAYDSAQDDDAFAVLRRADGALYEAKQSGRNRVCMAHQPKHDPAVLALS